jgi:hypothetical protein
MRKLLFFSAIFICLASSGYSKGQNPASQQLNKLFEDSLEFDLQEDPLFATFYGDHRFDDKLPQNLTRRCKQMH